MRTSKGPSDQACSTCDAGFTGLNCNLCDGLDSCDRRQRAVGRGTSGVASSGLVSINNTLTCHNQPHAVTQNNVQCDVDQATLATLFPGRITLTAIKVAREPNWDTTGLAQWDASGNSSYAQIFLDGVEQVSVACGAPLGPHLDALSTPSSQLYCQSTGCISTNTTKSVGASAPHGTELWSCSALQCYCLPGSRICSNPTFPLAGVINALNGSLDFPCDYLDPMHSTGVTECAFSSSALNQFVGPAGLTLKNCRFGQCISQYDLEQDWLAANQAQAASAGSHLSAGVTAGLAILGIAVAALLAVFAWGYIQLQAAKKRALPPNEKAVGLAWENIDYRVTTGGRTLPLMKRRIFGTAFADDTELKSLDCVTVVSEEEISEVKTSGSSRPLDGLGGQRILEGVTGKADPGQLTIIIGASGAGKSSLIDILGGRYKRGQVSGRLSLLAERAVDVGGGRRRIAIVDQDDSGCLPGYMTVRECLSFAAELSNQEAVSASERAVLVDAVIDTLALTRIAGSRIGDARNRGISGGEARRVSLGVALVARPKILIADECTSGLDAVSARRVMDALRALATGPETGTTVIATLHQPSSDVFHMADSVILLDRGTVVFDGPPSQAVHFCRQQGMPVEVGYNVADSLMSYAFQRRRRVSSSKDGRGGKDASGLQTTLTRTSLAFHHGGDKPVTTYMTQLHALLGRVWIMTCRDRSGPATHILGTALLSIFTGGCFFQVGLDIGGFQNRVGSIFFIYILILFFSLSALTLFAKGRLLMMRERANGLYSPWSWLSSHLVYDLGLLRLVPSLIIASIVYWMVGLHKSAALFFQFLLITVLFNWTVSVYQMLLAALLEDTSTAILYGALFILFNIAFAGFILNLQNVPAVIRWLQWICPLKYALEAVASNELKDLLLVDKCVSARRRFRCSSPAHPCVFSSTASGVCPLRRLVSQAEHVQTAWHGSTDIGIPVSIFSYKLFGFADESYYRNLIVLSCGFLVRLQPALAARVLIADVPEPGRL